MTESSLRACQELLRSDKVTERKQGAEQLESLLDNSRFLNLLDINSDKPENDFVLVWDDIFRAVCAFMEKEAAKERKEEVSGKILKRPPVKLGSKLAQLVLKKSCRKNKSRVSSNEIINYFVRGLEDPFLKRIHGNALCQTLSLIILPHRVFWESFSAKDWKRICKLLVNLYESPPRAVQQSTVAHLLCSIIDKGSLQSNLASFLLEEYASFIKVITLGLETPLLQGDAVCLLLSFSKAIGPSYRATLCHIGSHIMPLLLGLWDDKQPQRQERLVEFLQIQMTAHFPHGVATAEGSKLDVAPFYLLFKNHLLNKARTPKKESQDLFVLFADILYQMLSTKSSVTFVETHSLDLWFDFVENSPSESSPWLEATCYLCERHQDLVHRLALPRLLNMGNESKWNSSSVLRLLNFCVTLRQWQPAEFDLIWNLALRLPGPSENPLLHLLTQIVAKRGVSREKAFTFLESLMRSVSQPKQAHLLYVAALLPHYKLPDTFSPDLQFSALNVPSSTKDTTVCPEIIERVTPYITVIDWVLKSGDSDLWRFVASVLCGLASKNPIIPLQNLLNVESQLQTPGTSFEAIFADMTFQSIASKSQAETNTPTSLQKSESLVGYICHRLTDMLIDFETSLVVVSKSDGEMIALCSKIFNCISVASYLVQVFESSVLNVICCVRKLLTTLCASLAGLFSCSTQNSLLLAPVVALLADYHPHIYEPLHSSIDLKDVLVRQLNLIETSRSQACSSFDDDLEDPFVKTTPQAEHDGGSLLDPNALSSTERLMYECVRVLSSYNRPETAKVVIQFGDAVLSRNHLSIIPVLHIAITYANCADNDLRNKIVDWVWQLGHEHGRNAEVAALLLRMLRKMCTGIQYCTPRFRDVLQFWYETSLEQNAGTSVLEGFWELLSIVARADPNGEIFSRSNGKSMASSLIDGLSAQQLPYVSWRVAGFIENLFSHASNFQDDLQHFENIWKHFSSSDNSDVHRSHVAFRVLEIVIVACPGLQEKCLFLAFWAAYRFNLLPDYFCRILRHLAKELDVCLQEYLALHMGSLVQSWLLTSLPLQDFPFRVCDCNTFAAFLSRYRLVVVPEVVFYQPDQLPVISDVLRVPTRQLLTESYGRIMARLLPYFSNMAVGNLGKFPQVKTLLTIHFPGREFFAQLPIALPTILSEIIGLTMGPMLLEKWSDSKAYAPPQSFHFDEKLFRQALENLKLRLEQESYLGVLYYLSTYQPMGLHELFVSFFTRVEQATRPFEKQIASATLGLGLEYVISALLNNQLKYPEYVVRFVLHHSCNLLKTDSNIVLSVLKILRATLQQLLSNKPHLLVPHLPFLIATLTPIVYDTKTEQKCIVLEILRTLVITNGELLPATLANISPFPSNEVEFVELNAALENLRGSRENTLQSELELFLSVQDSGFMSLESLRHLTRQLCSRQSELASFLQCSCEFLRLLHRLIYGLLKLASHKDQRIVEEAAKGLGELGPIDLASLVLKRDELVQVSRSPLEVLAHNDDDFDLNLQVITQLATLLFVDDLEESLQAGNVLNRILSSKQGAKFLEAVREKWDLLPYIEPFAHGRKESQQFDQVQDIENPGLSWDLLWDVTSSNFQEWITKLTFFLIQRFSNENNYYRILSPICQKNVSMCEVVLPRIIHTLLSLRPTVYRPLFSLQFNRCFACCAGKGQVEGCEAHVNALLNVVRYLRTKTPPGDWSVPLLTKTPWDRNLWLTLDYITVAKAALQVSQPFMSILCAEFQLDDINPIWKNPEAFPRTVDSVEVTGHLFESYAALGDTDGVQGFRSSRCHTAPGRIQLYELTKLYDRAWLTADALASVEPENYTVNLLSTLANVGWSPIVSQAVEQYYRETGILTPPLRAMQYECAWRLGQWNLSPLALNLDDESSTTITTEQFQPLLYSLAKSIQDDDTLLGSLLISKARQVIMKGIGVANVDCTRNVYPALTQLRLVQELDAVNEWKKSGSACLQTITPKRWKSAWEESNQDAEFVEPILAARCMVSKILYEQKKVGSEFFLEVIVDNLRQARKTAHIQPVNRYLELVETLHLPLDSTFGVPLRLEEARLAKLKNCGTEAISYIKYLARVMENQCPHHSLYPLVLQLQGDWLHEMGMEKPRAILDNCFRVAFQKAQGISKEEALKSCLALAKYADRCLLAAEEHMASEAFQTQTKLLAQRKADFAKVSQANLNTKNARYLKDTLAQDELELKRWQEDKAVYLKTTVENYIAGLTQVNQSEEQQQAVSRLVSLLLHNRTNEQIVQLYYNAVEALPTHSFIQVFPQLAARLVAPQSKSKSYHPLFAKFIHEFLERCTRQHPHHTLPVLLAQQFSYQDRVYTDGAEVKPVTEEDRIKSARLMLSKLRSVPTFSSLIEKMERLYLALIKVANDIPESRNRRQQFDPESRLMKIRNCEEIALPTSNLPISPDGKYRDFIGIRKFERTFELVGGINVPKRIFCQGTDGKHYSMLVKGNDDLRQDSVMQQVFGTVNRCLQSSGEMRKKNLRIRTYKVVPLSHRSGLIEWCEDTIPFANYLIGSDGKGGAHEQYYPEDFTVSKCVQIMEDISRQTDWNVKTEKFVDLCNNFHPVFRHFFFENYVSPVEWFERRLAYTRSVAAASMAGYIVGLGDRHSQNILIDKRTAEVIHIDLGIAFDQGMLLFTPETVPFRLTRDVVDGMAFGAVSGAFIKYCEATMEVLQQHRDSILTLIEVLIYDPLYVWRIAKRNSPSCSRDNEEEVINASAQRVLLRLQEKLQCIENETSLSVAGLVGVLVQKARDPQLLVRIYKGWKPFL